MTCKCGRTQIHADRLAESNRQAMAEIKATTPDAANYAIEDAVEVGDHLVIKASYPNCAACSYEGNKVMVFLSTTTLQALKWRQIDPHFRDPKAPRPPTSAPGPAARFPASPDGWQDAIDFAKYKAGLIGITRGAKR